MKILNPNNIWQAQDLPDGISFKNGIFSGKPTAKGIFDVPVTVSNGLGSSTQNIRIITKYRPGTEKYSILQNGEEIDKLTIPQLQAMVQDGSAQEKYNCTNTQIIIPVYTPEIQYLYLTGVTTLEDRDFYGSYVPHYAKRPASYENVAVNFCSFRNVTLQDGTIKQGLILQFDKPLWNCFAPFDTGDSADSDIFSRWRYSNLRQWLNASGSNWFQPAYDGDALIDNSVRFPYPTQEQLDDISPYVRYRLFKPEMGSSSYADSGVPGFLDFLPEELSAILQPVRIVTQAFFDDNNDNDSIDDPELVDGVDADITYDKVFIPSLDEMFILTTYRDANIQKYFPHGNVEGTAWEYYINRFYTTITNYGKYDDLEYLPVRVDIKDVYYDSQFYGFRDDFKSWGHSIAYDFDNLPSYRKDYDEHCFQELTYYPVLTRSASMNDTSGIWCLASPKYDDYCCISAFLHNTDIFTYASPAPAFVIC